MSRPQTGALAPVPPSGRFLALGLVPGEPAVAVLEALGALEVDEGLVVGVGAPLLAALGSTGARLPNVRAFPALTAPGVAVPSTQGAVWAFLRGVDPGEILGRARALVATNEELASAPLSAHVKRAAQESFEPTAFMLRRSMPWGDVAAQGLFFVAFAASLDPFERVLRRMAGLEDGIVDGLFSFTRPVSGGYYFCPPVSGHRLDLRALR